MAVGHWSILKTLVVSWDPGRVARTSYDGRQRAMWILSLLPLFIIHTGGAMSFHACLAKTGDNVESLLMLDLYAFIVNTLTLTHLL